ncbi:hypothetical protein ACQ1ZK_17790, partial [Enterococcus faecium]
MPEDVQDTHGLEFTLATVRDEVDGLAEAAPSRDVGTLGQGLALLTGRTSWRTGNPWLALPVLGVIALVWTVLVLLDSQLHPGRSLASRPL